MIDRAYEDKLYQTPTFAGAVRNLQTNDLRGTVMPRLRRVARMCSRTVSGTAYRFRHGSTLCSPTEEKILCRSPFRSGRRSLVCVRLSNKGKVGVQRGRETAGVPSFLPTAAGRGTLPPSADGESPAEVQRKTSRPERANTLTQFEYPAGSVQKRSRPEGANPPAAVRVPRSAGAEKKPPGGQGRKRCRFITIKN